MMDSSEVLLCRPTTTAIARGCDDNNSEMGPGAAGGEMDGTTLQQRPAADPKRPSY